jgi:hypothetical protein
MIVCPRCDFIHSGIPAMTTASQGKPTEAPLTMPPAIVRGEPALFGPIIRLGETP